jgi:site-specific recombinase XerD
MSVRLQMDRWGKSNLVVDRHWPDGSRFRRVMPNKRLAADLDARIHAACCDGSWRQLKNELLRGSAAKRVTLREFSDRYVEDYCKIHNRCWQRKRDSFVFLKEKLGDVELADLNPSHLDAYFRWRKDSGISNATLNRDLAHLKHMMHFAIERGVIETSNISSLRKFKELRKERPRPTDDQVDHFLDSAEPRIRPLLGFMRETGCRLNEAVTLKHNQVRKNNGIVIFTDNTKSGKFRVVPLTSKCLQWIEEMLVLPGCDYVFWNPRTNQRWYNLRKPINAAIRSSGLNWLRVKDLRRHYGITLSENGAEMHVIQAMLGHSSVKTTEEYYAHFSPNFAAHRALQVLEGRKQNNGRQTGGAERASLSA